jgi:hypothetical protein
VDAVVAAVLVVVVVAVVMPVVVDGSDVDGVSPVVLSQ